MSLLPALSFEELSIIIISLKGIESKPASDTTDPKCRTTWVCLIFTSAHHSRPNLADQLSKEVLEKVLFYKSQRHRRIMNRYSRIPVSGL